MDRFQLEKFKTWKIGALVAVLGILILFTILNSLWFLLSLRQGDHKGCTGYAIIIFALYLIRHALRSINVKEKGLFAKLITWFNHTMDAMEFFFIFAASIIILVQNTLEPFFGWVIIVLLTPFVIVFIIKFIMKKKRQLLKTEFRNKNEQKELLWVEAGSSPNFAKIRKCGNFMNKNKYHSL